MPSFSIITCCYNLEKYIHETYLSLTAQTHTDWEWIIVDDESQDKTKEIIKSWNDKRVFLLESEHLGNLSALRNKGIEKAKGDFIAVLDGDDLWEPTMLDSLAYYFHESPDADWCSTNAKVFIDGTNQLEQNKMPAVKAGTYSSDDALRILLRNNFIYVSASCFRAQIIRDAGGFNDVFDRCEDIELWLRLSKLGYTMGYIDKPLLHYRIRNNSLYRIKELEYLNTNFRVYESILTGNKELQHKYKKEIKEYLSQNHFKIGIIKYYNHADDCSSSFFEALKMNFSIEKFIWLLISMVPYSLRTMIKKKITTLKTLKLVFDNRDILRLLKEKAFWFMYKPNKDYTHKTTFLSHIKTRNYVLSPVTLQESVGLKLTLPKFEIYLRKNTSDLFVYNQVFIEKEYSSLVQLIHQLNITKEFKVKNVIDVGANIGFFTLHMFEHYPEANYVLIEPDKSNVDCIYENTKSIVQKTIVQAPLWSEEKILYLSSNFRDNLHWSKSFGTSKENAENGIQSVTLPNIIKQVNFEEIDILKIDIEGAEEEVICNLNSGVFDIIKILAMEIHEEIVNKDRILETLNRNNFYYYMINETVFAVNKQYL